MYALAVNPCMPGEEYLTYEGVGHCVYRPTSPDAWQTAYDKCKARNSILVTIRNAVDWYTFKRLR